MSLYYTVDRSQRLAANMIISLQKRSPHAVHSLQQHADALFVDVSRHGESYLMGPAMLWGDQGPSVTIELLFEYVRRSNFPHRPSRFQSIFGFLTAGEAEWFRARRCQGTGIIWEVDSVSSFRADMELLNLGHPTLEMSFLANHYWSGTTPNPSPVWECLLKLPVTVIKTIPNSSSTWQDPGTP